MPAMSFGSVEISAKFKIGLDWGDCAFFDQYLAASFRDIPERVTKALSTPGEAARRGSDREESALWRKILQN